MRIFRTVFQYRAGLIDAAEETSVASEMRSGLNQALSGAAQMIQG
jgi:hypothetical protein